MKTYNKTLELKKKKNEKETRKTSFTLCRFAKLLFAFCIMTFLVSDNLILRLAKAAGEVLGKTHDELMYAFGVYMVKRIGNYGYERILKVICRTSLTYSWGRQYNWLGGPGVL